MYIQGDERVMSKHVNIDAIVNYAPDGFWIVSTQGKIIDVNDKYLEMSGYSKQELLALHIYDIDKFQSQEEIQKKLEYLIAGNSDLFQTKHQRKNGEIFSVEIYAAFDCQANVFIVFIRDIEHRKNFESQSNISNKIFNNSIEGIMVTNTQNIIVMVNDSFCRITGYSREEVIGKTPNILKSNRQNKRFYSRFWKALKKEGKWVGEIWNKRKNGEVYPEWLTISSIQHQGKVVNYLAQFSDITEKKNSDDEKYFLAYHDHLTLLPNRSLLQERLEMLIDCHQNNVPCFALMFIDIDRFKAINDSQGHHIGDEILKVIAIRIQKETRVLDTVSRVGGDEFVIITEGVDAMANIQHIARKILHVIEQPINIPQGEFYVSASMGISLFPDNTEHLRELLSYADIAMYKAKSLGGNRFHIFDHELKTKAIKKLAIETGLHKAVENNEFEVWYQPQVNVRENRVYAVECLVRWRSPSLGLVQPDLFISIAEETGLINAIGKFVLIEAINQLKEWNTKGIFDGMIAINISGKQLEQENFIKELVNIIEISKVSPSAIELEVTESTFEETKLKNVEKLHQLREMGFKVAIDDFGTGYSSLKRIKTMPVDNLKIDKCFIDNITTSKKDQSLVNIMLNIAQTFEVDVIAEGIETPEQCQTLLDLGVVNNQGYLHSKPLPAAAFEKFIRDYKTTNKELVCLLNH